MVHNAPSTLRSMIFSNLRKDQEPQLLCDLLMEIGTCSTSITDADRDTDREEAIFVECPTGDAAVVWEDAAVGRNVWNSCSVSAHFPQSVDLVGIVDLVEAVLDLQLGIGDVQVVPNKDWVVHVQQSWKPIKIRNIVLRFPWHSDEDVMTTWGSHDNGVELQLEGDISLGTGEHPTTQLCLESIQRRIQNCDQNKEIQRVMDYGCGSGVLGMAACALAVNKSSIEAVGVDIDVDAVRIANANSERIKSICNPICHQWTKWSRRIVNPSRC